MEDSLPHLPQAPTILVWVRPQAPELARVQLQGWELSEDALRKVDDVSILSFAVKVPAAWCGCQELVLVDEVMEELDPQDPLHPCEPA